MALIGQLSLSFWTIFKTEVCPVASNEGCNPWSIYNIHIKYIEYACVSDQPIGPTGKLIWKRVAD